MNLEELGHKYGTDKDSSYHNYLPIYEELFTDRDKILALLEIGTCTGASLRMWRDYFPKALILGIDNDETREFRENRIATLTLNQGDATSLTQLGEINSFDIVIDDGSHYYQDQLTSALALLPSLNKGGIYVIEDVQTSHLDKLMRALSQYNPTKMHSHSRGLTMHDDNNLIVIRK
jgi:precorrin-6B methylase 2